MKVYRNIIEARNIPRAVVTIGTFDGVHLGHQAIFNKMKTLAQGITPWWRTSRFYDRDAVYRR